MLQPRPDLDGVAGLVFTSRNGVDAFVRLGAGGHALPVFAVGAATAAAARGAGYLSVRSADGDLGDLARLLEREVPYGGRLLAPGAAEPAGDLAALLPGLRVERLSVYEAVEAGAEQCPAFEAVLIHSPRAGRALSKRGPFAGGVAVIISPAAAEALGDGSGLEIHIADRPDEPALLAALGKAVPPV